MEPIYQVLLWIAMVLFSYLLGSVNNAILISGLCRRDIRKMGSGNPGAMNMFRSMGFGIGVLTLFLDALKGAIPALLGWFILGGEYFSFAGSRIGLYVCAAVVLLGHLFPIFYKFKGGKGVASTIGICFVINPLVTGITFVCGAIVLFTTKYGFLASFTVLGVPCIWESVVQFIAGNYVEGAIILVIFATVVFMHRKNIVRFCKGQENKTIIFGKNKTSTKILKQDDEQKAAEAAASAAAAKEDAATEQQTDDTVEAQAESAATNASENE